MRKTAFLMVAIVMLSACQQKLAVQPKLLPYSESPLEPGDMGRRPLPGTYAFHSNQTKNGTMPEILTSKSGPPAARKAFLLRGQERYQIYCSVCHGLTGDGHGMAVERGMLAPPSYTSDRLMAVSLQHIVDVIEEGYGNMMPYGDRLYSQDRWAVAAYIRVLQRSQKYPAARLNAGELKRLGP